MNKLTAERISDALSKLSLISRKSNEEKTTKVIAALREAYSNGDALFAQFGMTDKEVLRQGILPDSELAAWLIRSPVLTQSIPQLRLNASPNGAVAFDFINPFTMVSDIASCVFMGGAYKLKSISASDAFGLALGFCDEVFGSRFDDLRVFRSFDGWSEWFRCSAWDKTWIIIDKTEGSISLLCVTDMD